MVDHAVAVDTTFMLEVNASAILAQLRLERRASVSALAKQTGLSRQAVTRSLAVLEVAGLVEISAPDRAATPTGRPPQMVRFRAEAGYVVGVDVKPGEVRIAVADLAGDFVADRTTPLRRKAFAASLRQAVAATLKRAGVDPATVWHVSAAAPGIVDPVTGHVTLSPSTPEMVGDAIPAAIRGAVGAPLYVDNDIKLATEGERWRGTPHAEDSLVFIDWGERIGAGIVLRGELYRGASNDAGDLGYLDLVVPATPAGAEAGRATAAGGDTDHVAATRAGGTDHLAATRAGGTDHVVKSAIPDGDEAGPASPDGDEAGPASPDGDEAGPASPDGDEAGRATADGDEAGRATADGDEAGPATADGDADLGPFERWVGTRELLRLAAKARRRPTTLPELAAAAHRGDPWARHAVTTVSARFAKGVSAIRTLLDPEVIVIGGDLAQFGPVLLDALAGALRHEKLNQPRLEISTLGADAIINGAIRHSLSYVERERLGASAVRSRR